jgi:hypothetical protein
MRRPWKTKSNARSFNAALLAVCGLILVQSLGGCEGPTEASSGVDVTGSDANVDEYVAGLEKIGDSEHILVRLVQSDPIPQDTGYYDWTLEIVTADGSPLVGATVVAEPRMPAHGHGTFPPTTEGLEGDEEGRYTIKAMDLFMAGVWRVEILVEDSEGTADRVEYNFDLEG